MRLDEMTHAVIESKNDSSRFSFLDFFCYLIFLHCIFVRSYVHLSICLFIYIFMYFCLRFMFHHLMQNLDLRSSE